MLLLSPRCRRMARHNSCLFSLSIGVSLFPYPSMHSFIHPIHTSNVVSCVFFFPFSQNSTRDAAALVVAALDALCLSTCSFGRLDDALGDGGGSSTGTIAVDERRVR